MSNENSKKLDEFVQSFLMSADGYTILSKTESSAILSKKKKVNHILHFILTILTGFWLIVWILMIVNKKEERKIINISTEGSITTT